MIPMLSYERMEIRIMEAIAEGRAVDVSDAIDLEVDFNSLFSLYSQMHIRYLKTELRRLNPSTINSILLRVNNNRESLREIAKEYKIGPFKMAKTYLEASLGRPVQMSALLGEPDALPALIPNELLRREILRMVSEDPLSAPEADLLKECAGREYEELLINLLSERHMCFETEAELRSRGKPKTPDILFEIPMAIEFYPLSPSLPPPHSLPLSSSHSSTPTYPADPPHSLPPADAVYQMFSSRPPHHFCTRSCENDNDCTLSPSKAAAPGCTAAVSDREPDRESEYSGERYRGSAAQHFGGLREDHSNATTPLSPPPPASPPVQPTRMVVPHRRVINWIDSKALFANAITFQENIEQFRAYNNRYGRGLVIYWHGFAPNILSPPSPSPASTVASMGENDIYRGMSEKSRRSSVGIQKGEREGRREGEGKSRKNSRSGEKRNDIGSAATERESVTGVGAPAGDGTDNERGERDDETEYWAEKGGGTAEGEEGGALVLSEDDMLVISDHFPHSWLFPTGERADGTRPRFTDLQI